MASNPESVADIVKEMRKFGDHCAAFGGAYSPERWDKLCNRLEAAHKREVAQLRETLRQAIVEYCHSCNHCTYADGAYECDEKQDECFVQRWRKTLEETK